MNNKMQQVFIIIVSQQRPQASHATAHSPARPYLWRDEYSPTDDNADDDADGVE